MPSEEPKDALSGGVLHNLTHKIPGVPEHDESHGLSHQGEAKADRNKSLNHKFNNKGGHGLNNHERRVLPGVQNAIARRLGKD
jgi:hypothetical protein